MDAIHAALDPLPHVIDQRTTEAASSEAAASSGKSKPKLTLKLKFDLEPKPEPRNALSHPLRHVIDQLTTHPDSSGAGTDPDKPKPEPEPEFEPTRDPASSAVAVFPDKSKRMGRPGRKRLYPRGEDGKPIHFNADGSRTAEKPKYTSTNRILRSKKQHMKKREGSNDDTKCELGQKHEAEDDEINTPDEPSSASVGKRSGEQLHLNGTPAKRIKMMSKD